MITLLTKQILASQSVNGTVYSGAIEFKRAKGFCGMLMIVGGVSTTVTQQVSLDGSTFYDPVDSDGNALGQVCSAITADAYHQFSPVIAPYIRFKFVTTGASVTAAKLVSQE